MGWFSASLSCGWAGLRYAARKRLREAEKVVGVVLTLDAHQAAIVGSVVGARQVLQIQVGEVRVDAS